MSNRDYYGSGSGGGQQSHPQQHYNPQSQQQYDSGPPQYSPQGGSPYPQVPNYVNTPPPQQGGYAPPPQQGGYQPQNQYPPQNQGGYPPQAPYGGPSPSHSPNPYQQGRAPYPSSHSPQPQYADNRAGFSGPGQEPQDGEKGLGATVLGGASGGFLAHEVGGGLLGTLVGSVAGAIGANALEHRHKKHKEEKKYGGHSPSGSYNGGGYGGEGSAVGGLYPGYQSGGGSDSGYGHHHHPHHHHKHHRHGSRSRSRSRSRGLSGSDSD